MIRKPFLLALVIIASVFSQEYEWPIDYGHRISSNFGEFRDDHFHMGLDISTGGRNDVPVVAVADGYIYRISASFNGYGKALYLRTADNHNVVYGHLNKFSPVLETVLKNRQQRDGTYFVDARFAPADFPVSKGSLVGSSGNTGGSMAPHLHFEIRDTNDLALNPQLHGFTIVDRLAPVIEEVVFVPLDGEGLINASPLPRAFPVFRDISGAYELPDTINCQGTFGVVVKMHDRANGVRYKYHPYQVRLAIDDKTHYRLRYYNLDFAQEAAVNTTEDYRLRRLGSKFTHKLYHQPEYPWATIQNPRWDGLINLTPGFHRLEISVRDNSGNVSVLSGSLLNLPPVDIAVKGVARTTDSYTFEIAPAGTSIPITAATCYGFTPYGYADQQIKPLKIEQQAKTLLFTVPLTALNNRVLQFIARNRLGIHARPFHWSGAVKGDDIISFKLDLDFAHGDNGVYLQLETDRYFNGVPELFLISQSRTLPVELHTSRPTVWLSSLIPANKLAQTTTAVARLPGTPPREVRFPIQGGVSYPGQSQAILSADHLCSMQLLPTSCYDTTLVWVEPVEKPVEPENGERLSKVYQFQPLEIPLRDSVRIAVRYDDQYSQLDRMGLYYFDAKDRWTYLPTRPRADRNMLFTTLTSMEAVAVLRDTTAPEISHTFPANGGHYHYQDVQTIRARIEDDLAGVESSEQSMSLILDGEERIFAYQPIRKIISLELEVPLSAGPHELVFSATDRVGNGTSVTINFSVN